MLDGAPTLRLRSEELVVDFHCAICLPGEGKWYRAVLTAVKGDMVEAVLLDFGRVAAASVSKHMRRLMPQFTSPLPGVCPVIDRIELRIGQCLGQLGSFY